ncbi:hypothetical protein LTR10_013360 [Elasticomyces elasticus]|uniref:CW-type domain-containing protein n=1 Tax=Exophiala sideris TaxID=1016849 RepID=A0ABR0J639_9EURO|nr:hypothetical protein LTR10_013360 [Elasticomyces elasticus]KAK5027411.1 hypothetical protein LTS07_007013 [Exophiala sideris]KAK5034887.1 hypothetical protein LTR13_006069 [Exophiala sideris]KAK5056379.1 hypothetical protein LTR69_007920 [Exophiala sideris]KAK5181132.1 hypothetical protein LTR44_006463 [Eurotiomycetes sp. CCFEE 6388]
MSANQPTSSTGAQASNVGVAKSKAKTEVSTKPNLKPTIIETDKPPAGFKGDESEGAVFYWCARCGDLWGVVWADIMDVVVPLKDYKKWAEKAVCEACAGGWEKCEENEDWEML